MGYRLFREIIDNAPAEWTTAERLVAAVIADDANDFTRTSWTTGASLSARTGLSENGVRKVLAKLGGRGYEMRVAIGTGSDSRPVYSAGHGPRRFRVPELAPRGAEDDAEPT